MRGFALVFLIIGCSVSPKAAYEGGTQKPKLPYFERDGGKGIRLAVLEPKGIGLSGDERWLLALVQGTLTGDFNKYSAMTVADRQNLDTILAEQ